MKLLYILGSVITLTSLSCALQTASIHIQDPEQSVQLTQTIKTRSQSQLLALSQQALQAKDTHTAYTYLKRAANKGRKENANILNKIIELAVQQSLWHDALYWLKRLGTKDPHDPEIYQRMAKILYKLGQERAASAAMQEYFERSIVSEIPLADA